MPEPERKIEKLLRTFARRRRADAGEPFQMHPATRNLLQREVAERGKATPPKDNFLAGIFSVPRPRLIFAVSVLAVVAIAAGLLIPSLTKQKQAESLAQVRQNEMTRAKAPAEVPAKRELAADKNAETKADRLFRVAPETAKEKSQAVTKSFDLAENSPRGQLAESTDLRDNKSKLGAVTDGLALAKSASNSLGYFARLDADELLNRQVPAAIGGKSPASGTVNSAQTPGSAQFENRKDLTGKDAAAQAVLVSFQVVQAGDEVRVIDGDGSVYSGRFETPATDRARFFYKTESAGKKPSEPKDAEREKSRRAETAAAIPAPIPVTPARSFRVMGTNRTLNAAVILNGRFLDDTNVLFADKLDLAGRKVDGLSGTNFAPASREAGLNSRISGKARVGGKEIPIEARRIAP